MTTFQIENKITQLYNDSKNDYLKMMKVAAASIFRPMQPSDFKDAFLAISKDQGQDLVKLIKKTNAKNIVEFGTSFGISTLFLAQGAKKTKGNIVTTEIIESKARKAIENFKEAGVKEFIEVRIGNALETLKNYDKPIDLLLLDGWKNLYLPLFELLEPNYHSNTIVYVDNADMDESRAFLTQVEHNLKYNIEYGYNGKVALIQKKNE